jgi:hypothetical protein
MLSDSPNLFHSLAFRNAAPTLAIGASFVPAFSSFPPGATQISAADNRKEQNNKNNQVPLIEILILHTGY